MKKDIQILWAAAKYHVRKFISAFKEKELLQDDIGNFYTEGNYQKVLYWRAYRRWQDKRCDRWQVSVGTDLFEKDTNIKR